MRFGRTFGTGLSLFTLLSHDACCLELKNLERSALETKRNDDAMDSGGAIPFFRPLLPCPSVTYEYERVRGRKEAF